MAQPTIITRQTKGSALTWTEGDQNLSNLQTAALPDGGLAGEVLVKLSNNNWDTGWTDRVNAKTIYETVKNTSGTVIMKGTPVYQTGMSGNSITVGIARADDPTKLAIGVLDENLADESEGRMLVLGEIKGVDTSTFNSGDKVYLAAEGGYTNTKPTGTGVAVQFLGIVLRVDSTNGSGYITGTLAEDLLRYNGTAFEFWNGTAWVEIASGGGSTALESLTDVSIVDLADGDVLVYDLLQDSWVNSSVIGDIDSALAAINGEV